MLAKALAQNFKAKLLLLDVIDFSVKVIILGLYSDGVLLLIIYVALSNHNYNLVIADPKQIWLL